MGRLLTTAKKAFQLPSVLLWIDTTGNEWLSSSTKELYMFSELADTQHRIKEIAPETTATKILGNICKVWYFYSSTLIPHRVKFCKIKREETFIWMQKELKGRISTRIPASSRVPLDNYKTWNTWYIFLPVQKCQPEAIKACLRHIHLEDITEVSKCLSAFILFYYDS